ncbi:hypothetical protein [Nocardia sp. NBC_01009]|uniref:hypothetical protein n=1 Tax=Nocardia sp. NBC_01009 TaxID=2975996 RepID=UPI003866D2CE|nr:hypothetical protein OHA42_15080 [Nocardia sp. NBC_01009]
MKYELQGVLALDAIILVTIGLAVGYLVTVRIQRPPAGLFVRSDIAIMAALLVLTPFAYLNMPAWLVCTIFALIIFLAVQFTLAPVIGGRSALGAAASVCVFEVVAYFVGWSTAMMIMNDVALVIVAIGVTNMWVQTAMKPPLVAGLALILMVYDTVATWIVSLTADFVNLVNGIPFAPMLAARYAPEPIGFGLGDVLLLTVWPLAAIKAYGRNAGICAVTINVLLMAAMFAGFATTTITLIPVLTPLGPLIVAQHLYWRRRAPTTVAPRVPLETALRAPAIAHSSKSRDAYGTTLSAWIALHEGEIVGTGDSPGTARRAARRAGITEVPVTTLATHEGTL